MTNSLRKVYGRTENRIRDLLNISRTAHPTNIAGPAPSAVRISRCDNGMWNRDVEVSRPFKQCCVIWERVDLENQDRGNKLLNPG